MAPATQAKPNASLPDKLLQLAQTLQFAWFAGHVTLILCALRFAVSSLFFNWNGSWAKFSYRTAFLAAAGTYGIVVYKAFCARQRQAKTGQPNPIFAMLGDENVQYLIMALIWLFSRQIALAILPYTVYSVFHVATYTRSNLLPILQPQAANQPSALADTIGRFVKEYYDASMTLVAILEIGLWFYLSLMSLFFVKGSWILLVTYTLFFRVRHSQSTFMQSAVAQLTARVDALVGQQNIPPAVRNVWTQVKAVVRQIGDATDVNRFTRPQGPPKKAQ